MCAVIRALTQILAARPANAQVAGHHIVAWWQGIGTKPHLRLKTNRPVRHGGDQSAVWRKRGGRPTTTETTMVTKTTTNPWMYGEWGIQSVVTWKSSRGIEFVTSTP